MRISSCIQCIHPLRLLYHNTDANPLKVKPDVAVNQMPRMFSRSKYLMFSELDEFNAQQTFRELQCESTRSVSHGFTTISSQSVEPEEIQQQANTFQPTGRRIVLRIIVRQIASENSKCVSFWVERGDESESTQISRPASSRTRRV